MVAGQLLDYLSCFWGLGFFVTECKCVELKHTEGGACWNLGGTWEFQGGHQGSDSAGFSFFLSAWSELSPPPPNTPLHF